MRNARKMAGKDYVEGNSPGKNSKQARGSPLRTSKKLGAEEIGSNKPDLPPINITSGDKAKKRQAH